MIMVCVSNRMQVLRTIPFLDLFLCLLSTFLLQVNQVANGDKVSISIILETFDSAFETRNGSLPTFWAIQAELVGEKGAADGRSVVVHVRTVEITC